MKAKPLVGVLTRGEGDRETLDGIAARAAEANLGVAVFECPESGADCDKEISLLQTARAEAFIGFLYPRDTFSDKQRQTIDSFFSRSEIPVVVIGANDSPFASVSADERAEFATITRALAQNDGLRRLICLTGTRGEEHAERCAAGFLDACRSARAEISQNGVIYGEDAQTLAQEIQSGRRPKPDGIVCNSEAAARKLLTALAANGPRDIILTGYDPGRDVSYGDFRLTRGDFALGARAADKLLEMRNILPTDPAGTITEPEFETVGALAARALLLEDETQNRRARLRETAISATAQQTLDGALQIILENAALPTDAQYRLWLFDNSDESEPQRKPETGGQALLKLVIGARENAVISRPSPVEKILTELWAESESPAVFRIAMPRGDTDPLGVSALIINGTRDFTSLNAWCEMVGEVLRRLRGREVLRRLNAQTTLHAARDPLTGLFGAEMFEKIAGECLDAAKQQRQRFLLLEINFENLRPIADSLGANEADRALAAFADVILRARGPSEHAARIGRDKFAIFGRGDYEENAAQRLAGTITGLLQRREANDSRPYRLSAVFGAYCAKAEADCALESVCAAAETELLEKTRLRENTKSSPYYEKLLALRRRVYENPRGDWSIDAMCRELILSRGYFQKLYSRAFGVSFARDVICARVECAKTLLAETDRSIAEIADASGYTSYVHFMHQFKKMTALTPTEYRRQHRRGTESPSESG